MTSDANTSTDSLKSLIIVKVQLNYTIRIEVSEGLTSILLEVNRIGTNNQVALTSIINVRVGAVVIDAEIVIITEVQLSIIFKGCNTSNLALPDFDVEIGPIIA